MDHKSPSLASSSRSPAGDLFTGGTDTPRSKRSPSSINTSQEAYELPEYNTRQHSISASQREPWRKRLMGLLETHPRVQKVWIYFRGPRPKVDLSGAIKALPFLVLELTIKFI